VPRGRERAWAPGADYLLRRFVWFAICSIRSEQYDMATVKNRRILLARRPTGEPSEADFTFSEAEVEDPQPGQMLLRTLGCLSTLTCEGG